MSAGIYKATPLAEGCFVCKKKENIGILSEEEAAEVKSKIQSMKQGLEEIERSLEAGATIVHRDCLTRFMTSSTPAESCSTKYSRDLHHIETLRKFSMKEAQQAEKSMHLDLNPCKELLRSRQRECQMSDGTTIDDVTLPPPVLDDGVANENDVHALLYRLQDRHVQANRNLIEASTCLVEAVYSNNTVLMQLLTNALMPYCHEGKQLDFESLLVESIKRGCSASIVRSVYKLWAKTVNVSPEEEEEMYIKVVSQLMSSTLKADKTYVTLLALYLTIKRINNIGLKQLPSRSPLIGLIIRKYSLQVLQKFIKENPNAIDPEYYFDILNSVEPSMILDDAIYQALTDRTRLLSSHNHQPCSIYDCNINLLEKLELARLDKTIETEEVTAAIEQFMNNIAREMASHFHVPCKAKLVGSCAENTRCFQPDEFDYQLVFYDFLKHYDVIGSENVHCLSLKNHKHDQSKIAKLASAILSDTSSTEKYLNGNRMKEEMYEVLHGALENSSATYPMTFSSGNERGVFASVSQYLKLEPTGFLVKNTKFPIVYLKWRGNAFNHMNISIDVIPVLRVSHEQVYTTHALIKDEHFSTPLVIEEQAFLFKYAYSAIENEIIRRLPRVVRSGYVLAKMVRRQIVFGELASTNFKLIDDFEHLIKTYHLKTALLFLSKDFSPADKTGSRLDWAISIYEKLHGFLRRDHRIPHFFLNSENSSDAECLFTSDDGPRHIKEHQRHNMLAAIDVCMQFLKQSKKVCDRDKQTSCTNKSNS